MRSKDTILLEQAYSKILSEKLKKEDFPNVIDPNTLGSEENAMEVEFDGDVYWVDYDADAHIDTVRGDYETPTQRYTVVDSFDINRIIVNIGDDPEDHIVEITKEEHPELYKIISNLAREQYEENYSEEY